MDNNFFNSYPYTDFHELNLSWVIKELRSFAETLNYFVSNNTIKYADPIQWDITRQYEENTIVMEPVTGTAYISVKPVPLGVALSDTNYWSVVFDLGRFITLASQNFAISYEAVLTTTATMETLQGNWVVWNSILYEALNDIHIGDMYVVDGNIKKTTVEEFYRVLATRLNQEITDREDEVRTLEGADITLQNNIDAEVLTRQNADNTLQSNINAEALTRQNADNTLQSNIDAVNNHINNYVDPLLNDLNFANNRKFIMLGDSYLDYPTPATGYGQLVKDYTGLIEDDNIFTQGTPGASFGGYIDTYLNGLQTVGNRISDKNAITDILLIGGINDRNTIAADFNTGANAFYSYARSNYPNAKIHFMCIGYCGLTGQTGAFFDNVVPQYKAFAAANVSVDYIENSEYIFNQYSLLVSDKVHPTAAGSIIIARGIANWLKNGDVSIERASALSVYAHTTSIISSGDMAFREFNDCDKVFLFTGGTDITFSTTINAGTVPLGVNSTPEFVFGNLTYCTITAPCILTIGGNDVYSAESFYISDGTLYWINTHYSVTTLKIGQCVAMLPKKVV